MEMEELARKVQVLADFENIKKLQRQYIAFIDNQEFAKALALFTDDAELKVRDSGLHKGRKELQAIYLDRLPKRRKENIDGHLVGEPIISVNGDRAEGHWRVYIFCSVPTIQWVQGRNEGKERL